MGKTLSTPRCYARDQMKIVRQQDPDLRKSKSRQLQRIFKCRYLSYLRQKNDEEETHELYPIFDRVRNEYPYIQTPEQWWEMKKYGCFCI